MTPMCLLGQTPMAHSLGRLRPAEEPRREHFEGTGVSSQGPQLTLRIRCHPGLEVWKDLSTQPLSLPGSVFWFSHVGNKSFQNPRALEIF